MYRVQTVRVFKEVTLLGYMSKNKKFWANETGKVTYESHILNICDSYVTFPVTYESHINVLNICDSYVTFPDY